MAMDVGLWVCSDCIWSLDLGVHLLVMGGRE